MKCLVGRLTHAIVWILLLNPFGCAPPVPLSEMASQASETASQAISDWLNSGNNLEAVVTLGEAAIPTLDTALREGPSPASRELMRLQFKQDYQELQAYTNSPRSKNKSLSTESDFIRSGLAAYVRRYQIRAAAALGAIGGPNAKKVLLEVKSMPLSDGVRDAVNLSLVRIQ